MIKSLIRISIAVVLLLAALGWSGSPLTPARAATQTVSTCDESHFDSAIAQAAPGDTVTFSCSGTIHLTRMLKLLQDVTIDGGGHVTIDGSGTQGGATFVIGKVGVLAPNVTLRNLSIVNGHAIDYGGGIENFGQLTVYNTSFTGNRTDSASWGYGAGAIDDNGNSLTVIHSTFSNNSAPNDGYGGAIDIWGGTVTVVESTFSGNSAGSTGGGINNFGALTVLGSTFTGNTAGGNSGGFGGGGAIYTGTSGTLTVVNSTFSGNSSAIDSLNNGGFGGGGAIFTADGSLATITNSTFSGNSAYQGDSLFYSVGNGPNKTSLRNTILAYPKSPTTTIENCIGVDEVLTDLGGSVEDGTSCGFGRSSFPNVDPRLGSLANNGGLTQTMVLKTGSIAIGNASCSAGSPLYGIDQRGYIRPTSYCDAGAYDHRATQPFSTLVGSVVSNTAGMVVLSAKVDSSGPPVVVTTTTNGVTTVTTKLSAYPAHGQIFPTGTITFHDGSATGPVIACAEGDPITHAVALPGTAAPESVTCSTGSLAAGAHSIIAVYSGDGTFRGVANLYGPATLTVG